MTLQEIFNGIGTNPTPVLAFFIGLPILALIILWISSDKPYEAPQKYGFTGVVYAVCIPGILSFVLILYALFIEGQSLLNVNALVYYLPIVSMFATLLILRQKLDLTRIPGFDKVSGLLMILMVTFITILILQKTRIWVMFHGSVWFLVGLFAILFILFKVGWERMFAGKK